jgi:hypothetical protein
MEKEERPTMILDSPYSIAIQVPENIAAEMSDPPKTILVKFKSPEEKNAYVKAEFQATQDAIHALASAWGKKDREAAYVRLYKARNAFCDEFLRTELERLKHAAESQTS